MTRIKEILIEEDYIKKGDKVYWMWRFNGQGRWNYRLTPYTDIPYIKSKNLIAEKNEKNK